MYCRDNVIYTAGEQEEQTANASLKIKLIFLVFHLVQKIPPKKINFPCQTFSRFHFLQVDYNFSVYKFL